MIDVVEEPVERIHALAQALRELVPFGSGNDSRDGVERDEALCARVVTVDRERDADAMEEEVGFAALFRHAIGGRFGEPLGEGAKMRADVAVRRMHLVVVPAFHPSLPVGGLQKQPLCRRINRGSD